MRIYSLLITVLVLFYTGLNAQITTYPYVEDFEAGAGGWTVAGTGTWALGAPTNVLINSAASGANAWVTNLSGSYNNNESGTVVSPVFDFTAVPNPTIQLAVFWNAEFSWDGMVLQSSIDGGLSWQNVGGLADPINWYTDNTISGNPGGQQTGWSGRASTGNGSNGWLNASHALTGLGGQPSVILRVAFGSDSSVTDEGVAFDNVNIFNVTCPQPTPLTATNISINSADLGWTETGIATIWNIEYGPAGFIPTGVPTIAGTTNNPQNVVGLTPNTDYQFYVQSDCGGGDLSVWTGPFTFTTLVSCYAPTALYANTPTSTTADLGWTESGSATSWQVQYGLGGFALGTGTSAVTGTNPFNISGLIQNTAYSFYVRAICGPGDTSSWTGPLNFLTPCDAIIAPWSDDIEAHTPTTNLSNSQCWSASSVSSYDWNIDGVGSTPSSGTGPLGANSGSNYFYVEASNGSAGNEAMLNTPLVDITALTSPGLQFYYHMVGSVMGDLYIDIYDGAVWTTVDSIIGEQQTAQSDPWLVKQIDLAAYSGVIQVRFRASSNGTYTGDISLDDIEIVNLSCFAPSDLTAANLTSMSADLGWTEMGSATSWEIEYGATGFVQGAGTSALTGTNPYNLSGLAPSTDYDFYVRSICGAGDSSIWMGPLTFTTICATAPVVDVQQACGSYTWIDGMLYTSDNNTATYMLTSSGGCDSLVMLDLTIINVVNGITQNGAMLTATGLVAAYQWLDCDNNYAIIAGELNQSYTVVTTGNYAVEVNQNGCVDTSACVIVDLTGLDEMEIYGINVYPNPSLDGKFTVTSNDPIKNINVLDLQGRIVTLPTDLSEGSVDGSVLETGKYIVQIVTEKNVFLKEIVIMK